LPGQRKKTRWWNLSGCALLSSVITVIGFLFGLAALRWPTLLSPKHPGTYEVRVAVLDPQGRPIREATLHASAGNEPHLLPDGWWQVDISAAKMPANGWISLWAEHEDWDSNQIRLHLDQDPNPPAVIRLKEPKTWLRGRVLDGLHRPIESVRVFQQDGASGVAITDAEGRFELKLSVPPGRRVRLQAEHARSLPGDAFCYAGRDSCSIILEGT
jgi:hypothetical protein